MSMTRRAVPIVVAVGAAVAACGRGDGGVAAPTVRDSAGIAIVENTGAQWAEGQGWVVVDSPVVDIGGDVSDPLSDVGQVTGVVRLPGGGLAVANGAGPDIRFFDASGGHTVTSGRRGSGPGEFQSLAGLLPFRGDSVLALDMVTRRVTVLGPDGGMGRSFALGSEGLRIGEGGRVSLAIPVGTFADGGILGMVQGFRLGGQPGVAYRDTAAYVRFGADGAVQDTVARLPSIEMEQMMLSFQGREIATPSVVPLGRVTAVAVSGDGMQAALNDRYEIELRGADGRLTRLVRVAGEPAPITEADKVAHRKESLEALAGAPGMGAVPEVLKAQIRARVEKAVYPATLPFVSELRTDPDGNLWAQEVVKPGVTVRRYAVFAADGALLGRVEMPDRFQPMWIGTDAIAGVWKDADDVERVRVYALRKGAAGR